MTDDNDNLSSIADYYASQGMTNPQLSYDINGNPIYQSSSNNPLPVDVSNLQDYAATLPSPAPNPLPTHNPYVQTAGEKVASILTGGNGQERYQLFPERIARSALSLPTDVMSGKVHTPSNPPATGSEEDYSSDELLQRVQDMAALMGGGGILNTTEKAGLQELPSVVTRMKNILKSDNEAAAPIAALKNAPVFHSAVENAVNTASLKSTPPQQWLSTIANAKGVKPEELDWTGLKDWLGEQQGSVSKEQIQQHLEQNKVELKEVNKGDQPLTNRMQYTLTRNGETIAQGDEIAAARWRNENKPGDIITQELVPDQAQRIKDNNTKYSKYQLPGGEEGSYREKLLTLPNDTGALKVVKNKDGMFNIVDKKGNVQKLGSMGGTFGSENTALEVLKSETGIGNNYKSSHWDEPNILAHIRMNDRFIPDANGPKDIDPINFNERKGYKALHIEEIQSDWHQQGREQGYKITDAQKKQLEQIDNKLTTKLSEGDIGNPDMDAVLKTAIDKKVITSQEAANYKQWSKGENSNIPDAPFKKTWLDLAAKRMIREAAEQGKDVLSWTPGEAQAARYDLSKQVDELIAHKNKDGTFGLIANLPGGQAQHPIDSNIPANKLSDYVGKDLAAKIQKQDFGPEVYDGDKLKVGGEGMHYFYDKMLPAVLEKLTGQKMKQASVLKEKGLAESTGNTAMKWPATPDKMQPINYIDLPQSVKDTALHKGFPLFSSGLMLSPTDDNPFKRYKLTPVGHDPFKEKSK